MSNEVLRSYRVGGAGTRSRFRGRHRGGRVVFYIFLVLAACSLWMLYVTRDAVPMAQLIPRDQAFEIFVPDMLRGRVLFAASPVWKVVDEGSALAALPRQLSDNFGLPEWVLNNTLHGLTHFSGNDGAGFSDVLCVTRMSRIGTLFEKLHMFASGVEDDWAGGLALRALPELGVYYAVRGRVLVISPSRDALIHALTLDHESALTPEVLAASAAAGQKDEAVFARLDASLAPQLGEGVEHLEAGLQLFADGVRVRLTLGLSPALRAALAPVLQPSDSPRALPAPAEGPLMVACNVGAPLPEAWRALRTAFPALALGADQGEGAALPEALRPVLDAAWTATGNNFWVTWRGVDATAMIPVPVLAAGISAQTSSLQAMLASIPAHPVPSEGFDWYPRLDAESGVAHIEFAGGPSMSPSLILDAEQLCVSTSRTELNRLAEAGFPSGTLPQKGLAYAHLRPQAAVADAVALGREFAAMGAVRGLDAAAFESAAEVWQTRAQSVTDVGLLLQNSEGGVRLDLEARFAVSAP